VDTQFLARIRFGPRYCATRDGTIWSIVDASQILRSLDGGATWERVGTVASDPITAFDFFDSRHGLAVAGGRLHRISIEPDTELTPIEVPLSFTAIAVDCDGPNHGVVCTDSGEAALTTDAGATWRRLEGPGPLIGARGIGLRGSHIVVVGESTPASGGRAMVTSADSGLTWQLEDGDGLMSFALHSVAVSEEGAAVAIGTEGALLIRTPGHRVIRAANAANGTSHLAASLMNASFAGSTILVPSGAFALTGWIRSTDAGVTWKYSQKYGEDPFIEFAFRDSLEGVGINHWAGVFRSTMEAGHSVRPFLSMIVQRREMPTISRFFHPTPCW
jgi:photosystem II stability/assembly factor-like uncharacterized protein